MACTPVFPTECRRRSPPSPRPPSRSRSSPHRAQVLRLDRWLYPRLPFHLPADVDQQAGVRRGRPSHCPPKVLLNAFSPQSQSQKEQRTSISILYCIVLFYCIDQFNQSVPSLLQLFLLSVRLCPCVHPLSSTEIV